MGARMVWAWLLVATPAWAQDTDFEADAFESLDLERLLSLEVTVASLKALSLRESPGIVSVVTRDEMLSMGARDLLDVLRLVPGFFFGVDVQGVVGIGIRGHWAHEGKILLIVDGQEMNELGYQTLQLGHHFPVETLERIEIVRGPGSAIYGGNAELGVIKVVTRGGKGIAGLRAAARYGPPRGFYGGDGDKAGFGDVSFEVGDADSELEWSVAGYIGRSVRSDSEYVAVDGTAGSTLAYPMGRNSALRPMWLNGAVRWQGWSLRLIYDGYGLDSRDAFDLPSSTAYSYRHGGVFAELGKDFDLLPNLKLMPRLSYKLQQNWWVGFENDSERQELLDIGLYNKRLFHRYKANTTVSWDAFDDANLIAGAEVFYDRGEAIGDEPDTRDVNWFYDGDEQVKVLNFFTAAFFGQFLWPNTIANLTAGGRIEIHSEFGLSAVPRLALTRVFDNGFHAKLLAAQAYRMPSFLNKSLEKTLSPDNEVRPERTTVLEAEIGWQYQEGTSITGNLFFTRIQRPIIYFYDEGLDSEGYVNRNQSATWGGELEARHRFDFGSAFLAYAYYQAVGERVEEYAVEGQGALLGAPRHKLSGRATFTPLRWLQLTPSLAWVFDRYAFSTSSDAPEALGSELLLGLTVAAQDIGLPGLEVALIGHDLLNQVESFPQPYNGLHAVLPGAGRQVLLRLAYDYPF